MWLKWDVKGESPAACSRHTLTAHHDKVHIHTHAKAYCSKLIVIVFY